MISIKEEFGHFIIDGPDFQAEKRITILTKNEMTGEDMVIVAIKFCKRFNCSIIGQVKFTADSWNGGKVTFRVKCHRFTYWGLYEDGNKKRLGPANPKVLEKDLKKYRDTFGITHCLHEGYTKDFYFINNWNGEILHFPSLKKACDAASKQYGNAVCIYETFPYGKPSQIAKMADGSGFTPS